MIQFIQVRLMIRKEIPDLLFATSRPGYDHGSNAPVSPEVVSHWLAEVKSIGAKSIICLLNEQHLKLYGGLPVGLLQAYRDAGFEVGMCLWSKGSGINS